MNTRFRKGLLKWADENDRDLPWKGEKDPYYIWLSEIILQQTRVEQGLPYFEKFKSSFPTVIDLANAEEDVVMKHWEGLGYYSRARNLHKAAKIVAYELNGIFPVTYSSLLELPGVGSYTAAAIASFAYNLPEAVLDGNVYRVLSRYFGIEDAIDNSKSKKKFTVLANQLIDKKQPAIYNQAIMDFGAMQCKPKRALCENCTLKNTCIANRDGLVDILPYKAKKITKRNRYFYYLNINYKDNTFVNKRLKKDIWQNLYEFPLIESDHLLALEDLSNLAVWKDLFLKKEVTISKVSKTFKQQLTHQVIYASFLEIELNSVSDFNRKDYIKIPFKDLEKYAFPKVIDLYLQDKTLYLELL